MLKLLAKIDTAFEKFIKFALSFTVISLTVIINLLVLCRYVLHVSLGGFEEMPVFLMIICVWLGAGLVAKNDDHVRIDAIYALIKKDSHKKALRAFTHGLTAFVMWIYTYLAYDFVNKSIQKGDISSGVGFPLWWVHSFVLIGSFAIALYYTKNLFKELGGLKK